jgi:hypothetical protein
MRRTTMMVVPTLLLTMAILAGCAADRLARPDQPSVARMTDLGPSAAVTSGMCSSVTYPTPTGTTTTATFYVVNPYGLQLITTAGHAAFSVSPCGYTTVQGYACFSLANGTNPVETDRCYAYPNPSGVGPIEVFIYTTPVLLSIRQKIRNAVQQGSRLRIRTPSATHGVRG